jgi:murein DD-endopeptidase MepM/ murein hydrolase activator NlpD
VHADFPRALNRHPRRALIAVLVALSAALTLAASPPPPAPANELGERKQRVHREIAQAHKELRHSSRALVRATARVTRTEQRLARAEAQLESRQAEVGTAEVLDAQMQSELDAANTRLDRARAALAKGRRSHAVQEEVLRSIAAETYQAGSPDLMGLTMVLTSTDPAELSTQLSVVRNVLDKETAALQRLEASRLLLALQRERVAEARVEVAERRKAAAETLEKKQAAEARAATASDRVARALESREQAREKALRTKRADERRLQQLKKERDKVTRLIKKREARERRRKSRAAIAKAKKASIARAQKAKKAKRSLMRMPVDTYITSQYGMRLHPIYREWRLHDGTDFGASCGRPVRAAASGRVIGRYYNVGYGNRVIISHGYLRGVSVTTTYNHLSRYSTYVGQRVRQGEIIGFVGSTGFSTGCHLHFMVFRNGRTVDPMNWL